MRRLAFSLLLALLGCFPLATVPAHRLEPPAELDVWWAEIEACSGVHKPIPEITWWEVPGWGFKVNGHWVAGHTDSQHEIWLAASWIEENSSSRAFVMKHELLHILLYPVSGHPAAFATCQLLWSVPESANVVD